MVKFKQTIVQWLNSIAAQALLWGMLGAGIMLSLSHWLNPPPQIATVNLTQILQTYAQSQAKLAPAVANANLAQFAKQLEPNLQRLAVKHHWVLVPTQAVIAGAPDVTDWVQ